MKRHALAAMLAALIILPLSVSVFADTEDDSEFLESDPIPIYPAGSDAEIWDGGYSGYDLKYYYSFGKNFDYISTRNWWLRERTKDGFTIEWMGYYYDFSEAEIKIPDTIDGTAVARIKGSCGFKKFNLNPENKYMKCVDNVIFSKDGKRLISYATQDKRREYIIPEGTEIIDCNAMWGCAYLHTVTLPDSVNEIMNSSLRSNLSLVNFYDFDVSIDRMAFGFNTKSSDLMLKSGVTVFPESQGNTISWDSISNASYYEIYQKLSSGEYTLLGKTKSTAHTFGSLKPGAECTFAVKPVAVIPAANYDKKEDEGRYPETFTIEGTMSEDVVVKR